MKKNILLATTLLGALALSHGLAHAAAAAAAPTSATTDSATTIGEVVVTAEKREANLQRVPVAVTAFTSGERNLKGISTVNATRTVNPLWSTRIATPLPRGDREGIVDSQIVSVCQRSGARRRPRCVPLLHAPQSSTLSLCRSPISRKPPWRRRRAPSAVAGRYPHAPPDQ